MKQNHSTLSFCFLSPFRLFIQPQNPVNILLDNVVLLDLLFQLAIVCIQGFLLLLEFRILRLQGSTSEACCRSAPPLMFGQRFHAK